MFVEDAALVDGYPARLAAVGLRHLLDRGFYDRLPAADLAALRKLTASVELAGERWFLRRNGNPETLEAATGAQSEVMSTTAAAVLLGVTPRRARQLAAAGLGVRVGGRWALDRRAVVAELTRRRDIA